MIPNALGTQKTALPAFIGVVANKTWRSKAAYTGFQVTENDSETWVLSSLTNSVHMLRGLWNLLETEYAEASIRQRATLGCVG